MADNRRLEVLAHTDRSPRVLNRRALTERLKSNLERAKRDMTQVSLLLIDIDHFKRVDSATATWWATTC
ncbi:MAG: diguanylate cyclase [Gemmatimonadetes bacterium]|nr:diguanylate cyclase [Gemmatimonadota bacterium]